MSFRALPPEIICRVGLYGQLMWLRDVFDDAAQPILTPITDCWEEGSRRKAVELSNAEKPCLGSTGFITHCLKDADPPPRDLSFLQTLSRVSRWIYSALLHDKQLWRLENTLYKALVVRAGPPSPAPAYSASLGGRVHYENGVLIAERVCSHIHGFMSWYPSLSKIKISTSWHHPDDPTQSVSDMFLNHLPESDGPLLHFDLCLDGLKGPMRPQRMLQPKRASCIRFCRVVNTDFFLFGPHLRDLYIGSKATQWGWEPIVLRRNFLNALAICANHLEYLTLDLSKAHSFIRFRPDPEAHNALDTHLPTVVNLPALRYMRLSVPEEAACDLLLRLSLPSEIDLHLEPAVDTRNIVFPQLHAERPAWFSKELPPDIWWKFAASLEAPEQTPGIFGSPGLLLPTCTTYGAASSVLALDIQIPGPYRPLQPQFPKSVSVLFADSPRSATSVVADGPGYLRVPPPSMPSRETPPPIGRAPLRSLILRHQGTDGMPPTTFSGKSVMNPVHAAVGYVMALVTKGQLHTPYSGRAAPVKSLEIMPASWCPETKDDWNAALKDIPRLSRLAIHSLVSRPGSPDKEWRHGVVTLGHLQGIMDYLGDPNDGQWQSPQLELIAIEHYAPMFCSREKIEEWLMTGINSSARIASGAHRVTCVLGEAGTECKCIRRNGSTG